MSGWIFLFCAVALDVVANIALKLSKGFQKRGYGMAAIVCVLSAFACLAQALYEIDLSTAYALWGVLGICLTLLCDYFMFGQKLGRLGWAGISCMLFGVGMLHFY